MPAGLGTNKAAHRIFVAAGRRRRAVVVTASARRLVVSPRRGSACAAIPNGPFSSPPANPGDARAHRPIQEISDTVGHQSAHVPETVYRPVIVPEIGGGATVMDNVFNDDEHNENPQRRVRFLVGFLTIEQRSRIAWS
jgi:hypothetical protein